VLVMPTIMNATEAVRAKARALADSGYLALITDFYGRQPADSDDSRAMALELRATPDSYRTRLRAGLRALAAMPEARGLPFAGIGFCMGGQAVLELARDGAPLSVVVSFHGLLDTERPAPPGGIAA